MKTIAAAANPRAMIYAALSADAPLLALLDSDPLRILPRIVGGVPLDPKRTPRPFLLVRFEGDGVADVDDLGRGVWAFEAHDEPGRGLIQIDRLLLRIPAIFHGARWAIPTDSAARPRHSWRAGTTGELPDAEFMTIKRIARIQLYGS